MVSRVLKFVAATIVLGISVLPTAAAQAVTRARSAVVRASAGPNDVITSINNVRAGAGVAPVVADATLNSVAQQWANQMASTGSLTHNQNLAVQMPSGWTKMGENIGDGWNLSATLQFLVASPPHYANMADPAFNRTGAGVATDAHGQVWVVEDFGAYPPPPSPTLVFPTNGTVIFPSPQPFSWQQVPGGMYYCVTVGTTPGGVDLVNSGLLQANQLSYTVPGLPGSQELWARVYSYVQGTWTWTDAAFSVSGPNTATLTRPTDGATNVDTSQPVTWTPVGSALYYGLTVGTTPGGYDLVSTGPLPASQTSYAVPALPAGPTLYARMYSYIAGSWNHFRDITFTAAPR